MNNSLLPPLLGLFGMLAAFVVYRLVMKYPDGEDKVKKIGDQIHTGALAFMKTEYKFLLIFIAVLVVLAQVFLGTETAIAVIVGAACSSLAGFIGMYAATKANVRTATAAQQDGAAAALSVSFYGGSVMGLCVASLGLIGLGGLYYFYAANGASHVHALEGFGMGASVVALFSRVGGGIFTKAADVGADLVGKVEAGIPEDDPRNPAVIADNVGDNVGDCAGMAADLFETYVVTVGATMVLIALLVQGVTDTGLFMNLMSLPLLIGGVCVITSIIGTYFVRLGGGTNIMGAMYKGFLVTAVLSVPAIWWAISYALGGMETDVGGFTGRTLFYCSLLGLVITGLIIWITEYYTGTNYRPVRSIAKASETGHGTNVIQGLAISLESTAMPTIVICAGIIIAYQLAGVIGIAFAATAMLALAGMVVALDAYGPVTDNAGGIAEMAGLDESVREKTDALDAVGNTTKAVTKGYAIGSAGLAALVLFACYTADLREYFPELQVNFSLENPYVIVGLLLGALLPYLFGAMGMTAVGRAAGEVVKDVRDQFANDPGIMTFKSKPNYARTVDLVTKAAIKEMIIPSLLPVLTPIAVYFIITAVAGQAEGFAALGALLLGVIVGGLFVAISMTSGGGAWDNAKKYIEDGNHGGKGSEAHKAAVTGDTVGDPYKDTAGPAVNPMIKITNIVALLLLAALAHGAM